MDVVWPALVVEERLGALPAIAGGLVIEWPFVRAILATSWSRGAIATVVANGVSAVLGLVALPSLGALWEVTTADALYGRLSPARTEDVGMVVALLLAVSINVAVETWVLVRGFGAKASWRTVGLLACANALSVGLAAFTRWG